MTMTSLSELRIIPRSTFTVMTEIEGGRFRRRLLIQGPVNDYTDDELLLHYGGDARFGDRVDRSDGNACWVSVWSD